MIDHEVRDRLLSRIAPTEGARAPAVLDETLAFLGRAAISLEPLRPSPEADLGWHVFILHTRDYAEYCDRTFGRFLHHVPAGNDCENHCNSQVASDHD